MILTIMLWLGMQGQAQTIQGIPTTSAVQQQCIVGAQQVPCDSGIPGIPLVMKRPDEWQCPSTPAEHVFEIRTNTEDHGTAKDERSHGLGGTPHCDDPEDVLESPNQCHEGWCNSMYIAPHCVRLTRELWMDGKRIGIVKGLEP